MLNKKVNVLIASVAITLLSSAASALTVSELTEVSEEIVLLEAKIKRDKLKIQVLSSMPVEQLTSDRITHRDIKLPASTSGFIGFPAEEDDPIKGIKIASIEGYDSKMVALATYDGLTFFQVRPGDQVTSKWKVASIKFGSVIFKSKKGKTKQVTIGGALPSVD